MLKAQPAMSMNGIHNGIDCGAFNTITGAASQTVGFCSDIQTGAPIFLRTGSSLVSLGKPAAMSWSDYADNNIIVTGDASSTWRSKIVAVQEYTDVGNIDQNYWGNDFGGGITNYVDPTKESGPCLTDCDWTLDQSGEVDAYSISYSAAAGKRWDAPRSYEYLNPFCGTSLPIAIGSKGETPKPASMPQSPATYCDTLFGNGIYAYPPNKQWQKCYDTLRKFIEYCPNYPQSYRAFNQMTTAVQALADPSDAIYDSYRSWLESVLYLNTIDPEYFCACVEAMPFPDPADSTPALIQRGTNRQLAVIRWLLQNTNCDTAGLRRDYNMSRKYQFMVHAADSADGNYYPLDTTLPSMLDLGLDTLLQRHFLYSVSKHPQGFIAHVSASPNPLRSGTVISFGISKEAYVKIEVFDILGNRVSSAGFESLFEPGNKSVPISLQGLPSGTYFARIVTAYGEVQTVKLVKE